MPLLPQECALQHERAPRHAPRPLPLFLELVRHVAQHDPALARAALDGLATYEAAPRAPPPPPRPEVARVGPASLRDHGGSGPPAVLIPSLINPPDILDLDRDVSLTRAVAAMGRRCLLLDWGEASRRADLDITGHVTELLVPLVRSLDGGPALVGYCLGGTMALAAATLLPSERVATLAAPWDFSAYPDSSRQSLSQLWSSSRNAAEALGALPMEVLQGAFWSLDPERTVRKFADFAGLDPGASEARRFIALEDWANQGEPLPCPAGRELIEDFFGRNLPGSQCWQVGGRVVADMLPVPTLHFTASRDRITPSAAAPQGACIQIAAGHVGMVVGSRRADLHDRLRRFLDPACPISP